jgi:hypothetical protein
MIEKERKEEHPPWIGDNMENILTRMMAVPKEAGTARLKECTLSDLLWKAG